MIHRRSIVRILLSLLLLLSQQMAFTHALSHWSAKAGVHASRESAQGNAQVADLGCDQCLAFAQLAGPLGDTPRAPRFDALASQAVTIDTSTPAPARTVCAFDSRAPPVTA